ncbi:dephospho-CoA kinase [Marinisporobacter balticus]|uniref:Dephospho-CoA kinase n=1 Tax=Marinisporobacter balticus TaxID=2018667 RepID=A0A4R2L7A8_9FIRM|nr:dephospho-CoA kinase [Marinisporobacter balticus]TCO80009.1 dephospho-CoA kinase [Marinisporobacter balticus]
MKIIGLTGGIASGKSTASNILKELGIPVIDADLIAREIVAPGKPTLDEIKQIFGEVVVHENGTLNRKYLGEIVFSDKNKLRELNYITHKRIIEEIINKINIYRKTRTYPVIIIDAALLIEMDMKKIVDVVWLVITHESIQLKRLIERDHVSCEDGLKRIKSQMATEEKKKYADVVIDNNQDIMYLKKQIEEQLRKINR